MQPTFEYNQPLALASISNGGVVATCKAIALSEYSIDVPGTIIAHRSTVVPVPPMGGGIKDVFRKLFLGNQEEIVLIPAQHNAGVRTTSPKENPAEVFTYATLEAARKFSGILEQVEGRIKRVDQLAEVNGAGNLITFGSPTSNHSDLYRC